MTSTQLHVTPHRGLVSGYQTRPAMVSQQSSHFVVNVDAEMRQCDDAQRKVAPRIERGGCRG